MPSSAVAKGSLLIASPEIEKGLFSRSVILVCEHTANSSFGLILNKTLNVTLPKDLVNTENPHNPHLEIREGGPVQTGQMMLLHSAKDADHQMLNICDNVFLGGGLDFLEEVINNPEGPYIRLCFGYAGWSSGQLEKEINYGIWFMHPASYKYVFEITPDKLWQQVLRDMGGKHAVFSMIPEDLSLN
jgi:putative transcriptional regulator